MIGAGISTASRPICLILPSAAEKAIQFKAAIQSSKSRGGAILILVELGRIQSNWAATQERRLTSKQIVGLTSEQIVGLTLARGLARGAEG